MDVSAKYQHWMAESRWQARDSLTVKTNGAAGAAPPLNGPVLPRIASLLNSIEQKDDRETMDVRRLSVAGDRKDRGDDRIYREPSRRLTGLEGAKGWRSSTLAPATTWDHQFCPNDVPATSSVMRPDVRQEFGSRDVAGAVSTTSAPKDAALVVSRVGRPLPQSSLDAYKRGRHTSIESSSCSLPQLPMQPMMLGSPSTRQEHHFAGHRRLLYHHIIEPLSIHGLSMSLLISPTHQDSPLVMKHLETSRDFSRQVSPPYVHEDHFGQAKAKKIRTSAKKRRRVVTPDTTPCQPSYESVYGQAGSKTSKAPKYSRYGHNDGPVDDDNLPAPRQRNVLVNLEDIEKFDSRIKVGLHLCYSRNEEVATDTATATETPAPALRTQPDVKRRESSPHPTLALKSKDLLTSNNFVRNRHGEVDWVATFLNVGFDSSSIYALMCPLRKGRWKLEEESYTLGLLQLIENGTIPLRHGQSIRSYIGEKLHSDDMRVLKKLSNCKMFHFAKLINPRLIEKEDLNMAAVGAHEGLRRLDRLRGEFLRSVQLEALVAVRKHLSDSSLRDLLSVRA